MSALIPQEQADSPNFLFVHMILTRLPPTFVHTTCTSLSLFFGLPPRLLCKGALVAATELKHPQAGFPIPLMVDASVTHISVVLQHLNTSAVRPWSCSPSSPGSCYLLRPATAFLTVSCPLICPLVCPSAAAAYLHLRVQKNIHYLPGVENVATDAMSLPPELSCLAPMDLLLFLETGDLSADQLKCSFTAALT